MSARRSPESLARWMSSVKISLVSRWSSGGIGISVSADDLRERPVGGEQLSRPTTGRS